MPARSKVEAMPPAVKAWLDEALVQSNFSGYELLSAELEKRGCVISKSALHRYSSKFEESLAKLKMATEQARAVVAASPDEAGDMSEALMRLCQQKTFQLLVDADVDPSKVNFEKLTLNVARLARAAVPLKKFNAEAKEKLRKVLDAAQAAAEGDGETNALTLLRRVREEAYGIFDDA